MMGEVYRDRNREILGIRHMIIDGRGSRLSPPEQTRGLRGGWSWFYLFVLEGLSILVFD